jgi:hypothetical protein
MAEARALALQRAAKAGVATCGQRRPARRHDRSATVEPGDASPAAAASWARHKLHSDPSAVARIYTMRSEWPSVQAAISKLPSQMQSHVHYWIADPTGVNHLVPGSDATQWYWGSHYDITTANPGF